MPIYQKIRFARISSERDTGNFSTDFSFFISAKTEVKEFPFESLQSVDIFLKNSVIHTKITFKSMSEGKALLLGVVVGVVGVLLFTRKLWPEHGKRRDSSVDKLASEPVSEEEQEQDTHPSVGEPGHVYQCVVIGSGLSGLSTASQLVQEHGLKYSDVLVLDAQSYVGGRVRQTTDFIPGLHIDLGAELIHGCSNSLAKIAEENGMHIKSSYVWAQGDDGPLEAPVKGGYGLYYIKKRNAQGGIESRLMRYDTDDKDFTYTNSVLENLTAVNDAESPSRKNSNASQEQLEAMGGEVIAAEVSFYDYLESKGIRHDTGMMGMVEAGYANTLCSNNHDISLKGMVQWKKHWEEEDGNEDARFVHSYKVMVQHFLSKLGIAMPLYKDGRMPPTQVSKSRHADDIPAVNLLTSHVVDEIDYRHGGTDPDSVVKLLVRSKVPVKLDPKDAKYPGSSYHPDYNMNNSNPDGDDDWGPTQEVLTRSVVMTAPLRVLMSGRVDFKPPLPDGQQDALLSRNVNKAMKIILKFRRRCWPKGVAGMIMAGSGNGEPRGGWKHPRASEDACFIPEVWFNEFIKHPRYVRGEVRSEATCYCTAFLTAKYAEEIISEANRRAALENGLKTPHDVMCDMLVSQLDEVFSKLEPIHMLPEGQVTENRLFINSPGGERGGYNTERAYLQNLIRHLPKPREVYLGGMVYVWDDNSHPFIGGGYSSPRVGDYEHEYQEMLSSRTEKSCERGLFFAGEGSSIGPGATAHSAIDTGARAANQVSEFLKTREFVASKSKVPFSA